MKKNLELDKKYMEEYLELDIKSLKDLEKGIRKKLDIISFSSLISMMILTFANINIIILLATTTITIVVVVRYYGKSARTLGALHSIIFYKEIIELIEKNK